ncbi:MAG: VTT domain-containing protein [Bacteroidota bacterium]
MEVLGAIILYLEDTAPLLIALGAFVDVFFISGFILNGLALFTSAIYLHMSGAIDAPLLWAAAFTGTTLAGLLNYSIGYYFGTTRIVQSLTKSPAANRVLHRLSVEKHLFLCILICRFITFTRPVYALTLGAMHIAPRRFVLYEIVISFLWVGFWIGVLIFGEETIFLLTENLLRVI